ncbi:prepilin-type N-terminal cleavage/methylation domain-containing protein [Ruficoccus amylovorans]|uniref:Prepilin-type N-terminal cleavage/methylation domain-containing protein n=1 Tax=Ruficoccus amylovorans TaxID=1804625 RepID=A0A842HCT7_9BACT|nr:prepilin-type N-terminal cleavage/methylation domain-containing protein [Ruficoccus amylovorans]MBC2594315.1 prepilin-type N-terminal cleavage/methylation domain-containing protein [Ruficoccus amylovorans]
MARSTLSQHSFRGGIRSRGFSLIEVVLAIGVLSLAVVAMLGLFAPTMGSVKQVVDGNKATALVGLINSYVNDQMTYDDVAGTRTSDIYRYAWEQEDTASGTVDLVMSATEPTPAQRADMLGSAFVVKLSKLDLDGYDDPDDEAYVPFLVTIYQLDLDGGFNVANLGEANRVLSYPSAKLR